MFVGKVDENDNLEETKPRKVQVLHIPVTDLSALDLDLVGTSERHYSNEYVQNFFDPNKTKPVKAASDDEITQPTQAVFDPNKAQQVKAVRDNEITQPTRVRKI